MAALLCLAGLRLRPGPCDAVLLGDQAGLAGDRALQEGQFAGCSAGDIDQVARDLLAARMGPSAALARPPPSAIAVVPGSSRSMRAWMSLGSESR